LVWIDLDEVGVEGWAAIASVEPCPPIASGAGRVVTATFRHSDASVLDLQLVDEPAPIRATASHRFYSETRHDWVPAGLLVAGERLRTSSSALVFAGAQPVSAHFDVFNIEVERDHCYFVSPRAALVHNDCPAHIDPKRVAGKSPTEIDKYARDQGLKPRGDDPKSGRGSYTDPDTGEQRVLVHPEGKSPHAHVNSPDGSRLDIDGNVVEPEAPEAHLPLKRDDDKK
jgi:hypothetical protein